MTKHLFKLIWSRKRSNALLIIEVFFSFLVLYAVTVLAAYYLDNRTYPLGFQYERVWNIGFSTRAEWTPGDNQKLQQLVLAVEAMPETEAVAGVAIPPFAMARIDYHLTYGDRVVKTSANMVTDDFQKVMGLTLTRGRWFDESDAAAAYKPIVINERLRSALFGDEDPVGKRIRSEFMGDQVDVRVVGVVEEYRENGEYAGLARYTFSRDNFGSGEIRNLMISTRAEASAAFEERLLQGLQAVAPDWTFTVAPLAQKRALMNKYRLLAVQAAGIVAAFLLIMVALGLMGVLWQNVTRRTSEFGLRRAVGSTARAVQVQVLTELVLVVSIGVFAATVLIVQIPFFGLIPFIKVSVFARALAGSLLLIYLLTILAGLYPCRLATRIQPATALHHE